MGSVVTQSDEDLMALVAKGRADLLEPLVRRYAVPLLTFLTRMVADRHLAEELFQEVFLAVWVKRHQYAHPRPFRPWLYAIAMNQGRATFRSPQRRVVPMATAQDSSQPEAKTLSPVDRLIANEIADQVAQAITQLPPQQRTVVALRVWQDLPYAQIADLVGCSEGTVRSHMHHGLATLRELLAPMLADSSESE